MKKPLHMERKKSANVPAENQPTATPQHHAAPEQSGVPAGTAERSTEQAAAQQKITELTNDLQRTRADFENFRKRVEERQEALQQTARLATVSKLLPLIDDLSRAIGTYQELSPLAKSLDKTMGELELTRVEAQPGAEFNPDLHEAVSVEGEGEKEVIGEVLREGYYYEGELLRPAMVKVQRQS